MLAPDEMSAQINLMWKLSSPWPHFLSMNFHSVHTKELPAARVEELLSHSVLQSTGLI